MANNWAMVGFLPLFIGALVWITGLRFFKFEVVGRVACWGALGSLLYLILPLVESMHGGSGLGFVQYLIEFRI